MIGALFLLAGLAVVVAGWWWGRGNETPTPPTPPATGVTQVATYPAARPDQESGWRAVVEVHTVNNRTVHGTEIHTTRADALDEARRIATVLEDLAASVAAFHAAELEVQASTNNRADAHRAHVATIPLNGRVRLGAGDERTRKAHHAACSEVVRVQILRDRAAGAVVDAAVALAAGLAPGATTTDLDAADSVSGSNPGPLEVEG